MRIGIDLDGVCFDFERSLAKYLVVSGRWPEGVAFPEYTRWNFYEDWGLSLEEFIGYCYEGAKAGIVFRYGEPIEDAPNQLRRLVDAGHTIVLVTDRDFGEAARANTREWLYENDVPHDELIFTAKKGEVDIDYLIDDRAENYEDARQAGIAAFLLNRPWNLGHPGAHRVGSMQAFVDLVIADGKAFGNPYMCEKCKDYIDSPVHFYCCLQQDAVLDAPVMSGRPVDTYTITDGNGAAIREFETGATRDSDNGKLDFEGFLDPAVEWAFAEYMHANRHMKDGSLRASDNWQNGIPLDAYMKSLLRHVWDLWMIHRGHKVTRPEDGEEVTVDSALGGIKFNTNGYWRETLRAREGK